MEEVKMEDEKKKTSFEKYILPILKYIGTIGAALMCIAYMVVVIILIEGFEQHDLQGDIIFALVNAAVGLVIMQFLKIQGISFAKSIPENKTIIDEYYNTKTKDKKLRSIKYYWSTSLLKDILIKAIMVVACSVGILYIVIEGCHDYMLILLALVNLILFICFGLLALNQAYEFYNLRHIPYLKEQMKLIKENKTCLKSVIQHTETCKSKSKKTKKTSKACMSKKKSSTNSASKLLEK